MDFARAFTFVFEDLDWMKKLLLNALLMLIPVVGQIYILGWSLEVGRRVAQYDEPVRLPEINFGRFLGLGFKALVVGLVYAIPVIVLTLPMVIFPAVLGPNNGTSNDAVVVIMMLLNFFCSCLIVLYALFLAFIMPAAYMRMVMQERIGAALEIGQVFALVKAAPSAYLMVVLGVLVTGFIVPLGSALCLVGVVFTAAYANAVLGHFYGQAYRVASAKVA